MKPQHLIPRLPWLLLSLFLSFGHPAFFAQPCPNSNFIAFLNQTDIDNFTANYPNCDEITGTVFISNAFTISDFITDLSGLGAIRAIRGNLEIDDTDFLADLSGLDNLETIEGILLIRGNDDLTSLQGLESLTSVGGVMMITGNANLENVNALSGLTSFGNSMYEGFVLSQSPLETYQRGGVFVEFNPNLASLDGLLGSSVTSVPGQFSIAGGSFASLAGLESITSIGGGLFIENTSLSSLNGLDGLTSIAGGGLWIINNNSLTDLTALQNVTSSLSAFRIRDNDVLASLSGLDNVGISVCGTPNFALYNNPLLSDCTVESLCAWFDANSGEFCLSVSVFGLNATGCESVAVASVQCAANSNSNGNWNAAGTWDNNYVPASGTTVVINSGHAVTIQSGDDVVAKCLSFGNGGKLDINGMLTLTGDDPVQLVPEDCGSGSATICGTGTINGISIPAPCGIIINPGNSPGVFHINGDFNNMGGTVQVEINGTAAGTTYDQLQVSGNVTLGPDAQFQADFGFLPAPADEFDIILANSISGAFAPENITITGIAYSSYNLSYPGGNVVRLSVNALPLPTPNCQDITLPLNASAQATLTPDMVDPQAAPPTDPFTWSVSQVNFNCSDIGPEAVPVMLSVTDGVEANSCSFNVTLADEPQCITGIIQADISTFGNDPEEAIAVWPSDFYGPPACANVVSASPEGPWFFGCNDIGDNPISFTLMLDNGAIHTCNAILRILDPIDSYSCHDFTLQLDENGQAVLQPENVVDATTFCGNFPPYISLDQTDFDCSGIGPQTVTVSITPPYSAVQTCEVTVEVVDPPRALCQNVVVQLDENGQATLTAEQVDNGSYDACGPVSLSLENSTFICSDLPGPSEWIPVGGVGVSAGQIDHPSLAIAPDGTPYVAYQDLAYAQTTTVLQWNGTTWEALGGVGISAGLAHYQSLAIAPDGTLYVAYRDDADGRKTTVLQWNGAEWAALGGQGISAGASHEQSLAIAPDGTLYVAYKDEANGNKTTVLQWNGAVWAALGGAGISAGEARYQSLAIAPDGTPYVAYSDGPVALKTTVLQWNGTAWAALGGEGISEGEARHLSLAIAPDGRPYVAYQDWGNNNKTTVLQWNGAAWAALGGTGIYINATDSQSLAIASDGTPYVACRDLIINGKTVVLKWDGAAWTEVGGPDIPAEDTEQPSLKISPNGIPFLAFLDEDNGDGMTLLQYVPALPAVTLTVTDNEGNSSSCTVTITVVDNEAPVPDADPLPEIQGDCGIALTPPTATDNCTGPITATTSDPLTFGGPGTHTVTWTYDDGNSNSTIQTQTVIITDDISPVLTCQDITLELDHSGQAALTPEMIAPGLSDNCGPPATYLSHTLFDCNALGSSGPNYALEFLGNRREYVQIMSPLTGYADFTLEAWFVNDNQDIHPAYLIAWLGAGLEVFDNNGVLHVGLGNGLASIQAPTRDGLWHHIAVVREGTSAIVYLDGEALWNGPSNVFVTDAFQLGRRFSTAVNGQGPWMGRIDDIRIWNTARSALEIQGNRFNPLNGAEAGLAGYWPLDDGPGSTTAADASANDNHGALSTRLIQDTPWVDGAPLAAGNATSVLLIATDGAGNSSSCMATVSVVAGPLQAHCQDIFVQLDENGQASISPEDVDFGSYASCGALALSVSPAAFTCEDVGINTVTLSVMDDDGEAANCTAQVTVGQGFRLYGTGSLGGSSLYSMRPDGTDFVAYDGFSFEDFGGGLGGDFLSSPNIILAPDGFLYGITEYGGTPVGANAYGSGTIFKVRPDGSGYEVLHDFGGGVLGAEPYFKASLHYPAICGEIDFEDCFLYGTAEVGGINTQNYGIIFRYRQSDGLYEVVHRFSSTDGWMPHSGLTAGNDGFLYGTTHRGGSGGNGVIYRFLPPPDGEEAIIEVLHDFSDDDGSNPQDKLIMGEDGWLYGIATGGGGANGTLFRFDPGTLVFQKLYTFQIPTGGHPWAAPIALGNGYLYGTANQGGAFGSGVVYRIRPDAPADTYEVFKYVQRTYAGLTYGPDGYLYGATFGLANENGAIFRLNPDDPDDFAYIHTFDGTPAGRPTNRLILVPTSCCDNDLFPPELACPGTIELIDLEGDGVEAIAGLSALGFSAADDCTEATMSISPEVFPQGSTEATVTAVDEGGNTAACAVTVIVTGPCVEEEMKIIASDGESNENFGNSVAISGNRAIVGARRDNVNGSNSGSAYIYHWDGFDWGEYKLIPDDGNFLDYFGHSVAISGDKAIVGAYGDDDNGSYSGSAYLFRWDGAAWVQHQKLTASDGATGDLFGFSLAISGDKAIVGAYQDDGNGSNSGSAYLFHWDGANWVQQQKLTAADGAAGDLFGFSVSIDEDKAIVGAYQDDDNGSNSGSAYLFRWDGANWAQQQKITAADGTATDFFGFSVSIGGDKAIVGAHQDDGNGDNSGSAYLFHRDGANWVQQQKLTAADAAGGDYFGKSVSVSEDAALIGALGEDDGGSSAGAAYLFAWNGLEWAEQEKLAAFDAAGGDRFGYSVALSGNRAAVGAPLEDNNENGLNAGAAYPFLIADTAPELSVVPPSPVCPGTSVDLSSLAVTDANNTGAVLTYHSGSPATVDNELPSPVVTPASPSGTYYILGTSPAGCTDEVAVTLQAPTTPAVACQDITVELNPFTLQAHVFPDQVASFVPPCSGYVLYFQGGNTALPPLPMIFSGCSSAGEYPVTVFLYTGDGSRRRRSCRATITVVAPPPAANCGNSLSIFLGSGGTVTLNPDDINQGSYAVCGSIAGMTVSPSVFSCADLGVTEVTLTVTTDDGQAASCTADINVNPWPGELCDGMDNNCNGLIDELPIDQDDDGYTYCFDCDDLDAAVNPGAPELCDGIDNNCNGEVDEGLLIEVQEGAKLIVDNSANDDPNDNIDGDWMGYSVSISGDWAIIGAFIDDNEHGVGAAYFFHLEGSSWVQKQKVAPTDRNGVIDIEAGWFGYSVSISGDRAIVGAWNPFNDTEGAAYLYQLEAGIWVEKKRVTSADWNFLPLGSSEFGTSVSISGDKAIIGARKDPVSNISAAGAAYLIHWDGNAWIPQPGKITANEPATGEYFGTAVSISGNRVIVGAGGNDESGTDAGSAYIFHWNGSNWIPYGQLFSDVPIDNEEFGYSVSISESRAIVGTFNGEAAYLFRWNGINWTPDTQLPKLMASDGLYGDQFGTSVSISGDMAIVGANQYSNNSTGKAYPFLWNGNEWLSLSAVVVDDPEPQSQDATGTSVSTDGERMIIGAPLDDNTNGPNAGAAYISATVPCGAMRPSQPLALPPVADAKATFTLFPNPALDEVSLQFNTPLSGHGEVWVYGLAGRLVLKQAFGAGTSRLRLPIHGLASGLYLVEVKTGDRVFPIRRFVRG